MHPLNHHIVVGDRGRLLVNSDHIGVLSKKYGYSLGGTLRADLVDTLAKPLEGILQYNKEVVGIEQCFEGVEVNVKGGEAIKGDMLIGADGINSIVARLQFQENDPPVFSGENIFYGVINDPFIKPFLHPYVGHRNTLFQLLDRGEFITFPVGGEGNTKLVWALTHKAEKAPDRDEWTTMGTVKKKLAEVLKKYDSSHPAYELAERTDESRLLYFGLKYRKAKQTWFNDRCVLLGDSAHATLPYVGQGANQSIEDAVVLADCLEKEESLQAAFKAYYDKRFDRTKRVVDTAFYLGKIMHTENPITSAFRDLLLAFLFRTGAFVAIAEKEIMDHCPVKVSKNV